MPIDNGIVEDSAFEQQTDDGGLVENVEQAPEVEAAPEPEQPEESEKEVEFNKKFAALSRKEKDIRIREAEYEQKIAEYQAMIEAQEAEKTAEPQKEPELPLEYRLKKDPLGTLAEFGYDFETLTELTLNDGKLPQNMQMQLMKEELKKEMEEKYGSIEQRLTEKEKFEEEQKYNKVIDGFKGEIGEFIASDPEAYELIQAYNANDLVFDIINEHHETTSKEDPNGIGKVLSIEEAAQAVESYLEEEAKKIMSSKKLSAGSVPSETQEPVEQRQASPTLSNDHSAMSQNNADRELTEEESAFNAAKLLKWNS